MAVSKVAPPHISSENKPVLASPTLRASASEQASMSKLRTRVAMSDWWASRKVVSVMSRRFCFSVHSANFFGPSSSSRSRVPLGSGVARSVLGSGAGSKDLAGLYPLECGLPLTMTLPRKLSSLVARSLRLRKAKSSGVVSMSVVVA